VGKRKPERSGGRGRGWGGIDGADGDEKWGKRRPRPESRYPDRPGRLAVVLAVEG